MAQPVIQTNFSAGEWSPSLNARVDLAKYQSAAALLENFFVDYRGGVSTRMGTKYILQAYKSSTAVRLISFQNAFAAGYVLEFGDFYIRFFTNGAPVLESAKTITGASQANPGVITAVAHGFSVDNWVYISSVGGMTQLNTRYFKVLSVPTADTFTIGSILDGSNINTTGYTAYTTGGSAQRVYTLATPYAAADLALLKFAGNIDRMVLTHPDYVPYVLTIISAANWTLSNISFGASIAAPSAGLAAATTLAAGSVNYAYVVTSVDANGQESGPSAFATLASKTDLRTVAGTNTISWTAVTGATRYNVYKAELSYAGAVPTGAAFGFIGDTTGVSFIDSNIAPDFTESPPVPRNPFQGAGVASVTVTAAGTYTTVPSVTIANAPAGGVTATANAILQVQGTPTVGVSGGGWVAGGTVVFPNGVVLIIATVNGSGAITAFQPITYPGSSPGSITSGSTPSNPVTSTTLSGAPTPATMTANLTWGVGVVSLSNAGAGYTSVPAVTFSAGAAAATAALSTGAAGNPSVPIFAYQRLWLAGPEGNPQQFNASQPSYHYNYDVTFPAQHDDAIQGTLVSTQLNSIKAMLPMPSGLVVMTDKAAWQIYGAGVGNAPTAIDITAQSQAYNGCNDIPPIIANYDIIYFTSKGSSVRNVSYSFYTNVYTGTDISVLSSHLFFGYEFTEWCWAEEPFKLAWAIRDDGVMLSLAFLKEQDLIAWSHHNTQGTWKSCAVNVESVDGGVVDAVYLVAERTIGATTVKFIERMADRFIDDYTDPWCVDAGLQYSGASTTTFTGFEHLAGKSIVGLADGIPFTATVSASGGFTLATAAALVTAGLAFTPKLQTVQIDVGNPTIQGKMKFLPSATVRVEKTLGLKIGTTFNTLVSMKDLTLGEIGTATNTEVTDLVTGDAWQTMDPKYQVPGQFCIQQSVPYPATILGLIPQIEVGDTKR